MNGPDPVVYCGSANLATGGEQANGDNLLEIHDADVATAFAIEALLLVDHYDFLDRFGGKKTGAKASASKDTSAKVAVKGVASKNASKANKTAAKRKADKKTAPRKRAKRKLPKP